jgi:hypothetical protein
MPQMTLQPDSENGRVWVMLDGQRLVSLRADDQEGLKVITTWLVDSQHISVEEAAAAQGVTPRTVEGYQATYAETANSADLVDRRHFGAGQQTAYQMEPHKPALVRCVTLNLVRGEPNSERRLAEQLGHGVDDRTVGRHLNEMGWRAAEAAGLAEEVAAYLEAERQRAYWAGVAGQPLEKVHPNSSPQEWQVPQAGQVGAALGVAHLARNGTYASLQRLVGGTVSVLSQWPPQRVWHVLLVYLLVSGGARLSQAKYFAWGQVQGLLRGCARLSATSLRAWLVAVAKQAQDTVSVRRSKGQVETLTRLQDYQEECVAQRVQRGLIHGRAIYLDDYINAVFRCEPIARAMHGTRHWATKAFRRHLAQDVETGHPVTCPVGPSDVTPLAVAQQVVQIIRGGLDRVCPGQPLKLIIADRWWSVESVMRWVLKEGMKLLTWGKDIPTLRKVLAEMSEVELKQHPVLVTELDQATGQTVERVVGYRFDTELSVFELDQPVRGVVDWDGLPGSPKRVRLVIGVGPDEMDVDAVVDGLRFRQRVEILLKQLQRRLHWPAFGGGVARQRPRPVEQPGPQDTQRWMKNRQQVDTRQAHDRAKLQEVEQELEQVRQGQSPTNGLKLGVRDLKKVAQDLKRRIGRAAARLKELDAGLVWAKGNGPQPPQKPVADLDLTREAILTQLKLDVFTAQETLVDDFIELALQPVLRQEAEQQAAARRQHETLSTAKGREGQPLSSDVEELYQVKLANLERETILSRLLNQPGEFVHHKTQRIILSVANRFKDCRMQAAYEHYCDILNERDIRVPMDDGEPWHLLFTYHLEAPAPSARFK